MHVRELLKYTVKDSWEILKRQKHWVLVFDDGQEMQTTRRETHYSRYFWEIHRQYPMTPLLARHHVHSVLKGKPLNSNTHIELFGIILDDVVQTNNLLTPQSKEPVLKQIYELTNLIYDEITPRTEAYIGSIDILDFLEVVDHPTIRAANRSCDGTHDGIIKTYEVVLKTMKEAPELSNNSLAKALKAQMVNANQVCQCVGVRGFPTEVDGTILATPILTNYTEGMNSLYNLAADSRSAAKALYYSEAPLQDSEYFARRLQLLCMGVEKIHYGDCGSQRHVLWHVKPPVNDERGNQVYPGDLKFMIGKVYLDETTQTLKEIRGNESHLFGKTIKMRSVLMCEHPNPHEVCHVCFGGMHHNVSAYANVGHYCSATMTRQTSQSVLSIKHLAASGSAANIIIPGEVQHFLATNQKRNSYLVREEMKGRNLKLIVSRDEAKGLTDIKDIGNVVDINPIRVSSIEDIALRHVDSDGLELTLPVKVSQGNRKAVLTHEFLSYLRTAGWNTDPDNNFVFDFNGWDYSVPFLKLPEMEYSYSDHSSQVAKKIESTVAEMTKRQHPSSPVVTLQELFDLVNTKLKVNMVALEVIIYTMMTPGPSDSSMGRNSPNPVLGISNALIRERSLAPAYFYEKQTDTLTSPASFFQGNRPDSPFDVYIAPREVSLVYMKK